MASISGYTKADEADLVGQLTPVIRVGDEEDTVAELIEWPRLMGSRVEYPTGSSRFRKFCKAKSSIDGIWGHAFAYRAGRVWNDILLWVSGKCLQRSDEEPLELNNRTITKEINCKVSRKESFIGVVAREGTELKAVLKELEISRFKWVASKDDKVRRLQAKRRLAGKTPGSMEEKLSTPELNAPLKLAWLNEILDGPVDVATVSSTVVRNLAKRKVVKRGAAPRSVMSVSVDNSCKRRKVTSPTKSQEVLEESDKIAEGADLRPYFEVKAGLLEEQCLAEAREKMVAVMDNEFKKVDGAGKEDLLVRGGEKSVGRELYLGEGSFPVGAGERKGSCCPKAEGSQDKSEAEVELVTVLAIYRNNLTGKLYQLRYTKVVIMAFNEGNYEEMEIIDEEEVEKREDGLNVAEKTVADNQETINQIESSRLRVEDLEGLLEMEKKSSAGLQVR
ncbi:hypothetical protein GIB67_021425 [Kingdonia uniflora]|uniref:Uncharacterized protein n=1 Tax=Kingdonia uniflora TaxID=39325 RepID=A0A7J7NR29_9MAGN|nr:hypothetical protein GIB67_021425 [Kingdonia uniflora]